MKAQAPSDHSSEQSEELQNSEIHNPQSALGGDSAIRTPNSALDEMIMVTDEGTRSFRVRLSGYDGPLDLLLELIKKNEMDIYNLQVSVITQQYLDYLANLKRLDLEIAGEFIVLAATLLYIKSKMLLPVDENEDDEDGGDPRAELVRKLLEYQAFKEAAKELGLLESERAKVFTRQVSDYYLNQLDSNDLEIDTFSADLFDLLSAFQKVLTRFGQEDLHEVYEHSVSIEERITDIQRKLLDRKKVVFSELFERRWTKNFLIATFLAILEIVRTRFATVKQEEQFGEIYIERIDNQVTKSYETFR